MSHQFGETSAATALLKGQDYCPFIPVFGPPAVMFERGLGTQLWDTEGKRYLDFLCGIAVTSLGHCHPVVTAAISEQANILLHVSNFFANPVATQTAVMINDLVVEAGGTQGQVFFCNSGAEANEAALKLARKFGGRGRHVVVSALGSFHGRTLAALAATGQPSKHEPFQPMPDGFRHVEYGDISALQAALDPTVAAVLLETVQGEGGVIPASHEYMRAVQSLCRDRGILFMLDEVQTGFARTGKWFGFQHAGLDPDVLTFAKAMGNGMPVGALWAKKEVAAVFSPGDHGSTYSGTALATAAVRAVITEMKRIDAPALAQSNGQYLRDALSVLPAVQSVRGQGLLLGLELGQGADAKSFVNAMLQRGLVVNAVNATTIRLAPPITVTKSEMDEAITIITEVLS
ncbi:MAG: acetylornithine/succinylornithine family transaminase [Ilumatobacteraceae bacterium]|nr:acetylornithine/succinylornithine family transaminase [Ilumatobacteraceae bacterium]